MKFECLTRNVQARLIIEFATDSSCFFVVSPLLPRTAIFLVCMYRRSIVYFAFGDLQNKSVQTTFYDVVLKDKIEQQSRFRRPRRMTLKLERL